MLKGQKVQETCVLLRAEHIAKSLGRKAVLKDVSLVVPRGKIVGIEGENGSGKTTLLKVVVGLLRPDAGTCRCFGRIGYCPQEMELFDALTVQENITYFWEAYRLRQTVSPAQLKKRISDLLHYFRFEQFVDQPVNQLSGGTRQKLNLVLALLHEPELLVLDEPYSAFDWETYSKFWDYMKARREQGVSVLFVSHLIYDVKLIDIRYHLKNGVLECRSRT